MFQNVTPDLTPLDKALHQQLADMNKVVSFFTIKKKQEDGAEDMLSALRTDNFATADLFNSLS